MKQNEPNASARTLPIYLVDPTGAGYPGLVAQGGYTIRIRKAGGSDVTPTNALIDRGNGRYELPLDVTEVDTAGLLWYSVTKSGTIKDFYNAEMIDPNVATLDATTLAAVRLGLATAAAVAAIPTNPLLTTDSRLANLDAAISTRARPADVPSATTVATQVDTTLGASHGIGTWQQGNTTVPPDVVAIATAVWNLARSGNQQAGTFGEYIDSKISAGGGGGSGGTVDPSAFAAAVWDQVRTGHQAAGSFGEFIDAHISAAGGGSTGVVDASAVAAAVVAALAGSAAVRPPVTGYSITQGDLEPPMPLRATSDYAVVDLTTATAVSLRWTRPDLTTVTVPLVVTSPLQGKVERVWSGGDTAQLGTHTGQMIITWPGGRQETVDTTFVWTVAAAA